MNADNEQRPYSTGWAKEPLSEDYFVDSLLSAKGRIRRNTFGIRKIVFTLLILTLIVVRTVSFTINYYEEYKVLTLLLEILLLMISMMQNIKRYHDLNMSGWYVLAQAIPLFNLYLLYKLLFVEGTIGRNQYGPDPKPRPIPPPPSNEDVFIIT